MALLFPSRATAARSPGAATELPVSVPPPEPPPHNPAICGGCDAPIGASPALELADGESVHFKDYDCLLRYGGKRHQQEIEAFWRSIDLVKCAGCGAAIRPGERIYEYCNPGHSEVIARAHSEDLECLITWNERWHRAQGIHTTQMIIAGSARDGRSGMILTDEQVAAVRAMRRPSPRETFALFGLAGTGKTTVAVHFAASRPSA